MGFAENLRQIRKEMGLTQEELADMMEVSRQAVSKWEQGEIYPEVEKLLVLAKKFNVSLDRLLSAELVGDEVAGRNPATGSIVIFSPNENVILNCYKVTTSSQMHGGERSPQYALFGVGTSGNNLWGEPTTLLGWYANEEMLSKEVKEIQQAMMHGIPSYELRYSAKVERKWLRISMIEE